MSRGKLKFWWVRNPHKLLGFSEKVTFNKVREQAVLLFGRRAFYAVQRS